MQNGGATQSDADSGGAVSLLDMCYQAIVLLNGEYEGMRAAKDNPQSFQRRLRVSQTNSPQQRPDRSKRASATEAHLSLRMRDACLATCARCGSEPAVFNALVRSQGIAYYLDTIVGGDGLLYQPSDAGSTVSRAQNTASGARDRASRATVTSVSSCVRAPSCVLVPYKTAFELRRILTVWVNNFGAFAAALVVGSCGSIITSTDPHIAAATDSWYVAARD